jgi:hypothetical protein
MNKTKLLSIFILPVILALASCRTFSVSMPDGRTIKYTNVGFENKIGRMTITTPQGETFTLENLDSNTQAFTSINKALDTTNSVINRVP